jgi:hypothetical protein
MKVLTLDEIQPLVEEVVTRVVKEAVEKFGADAGLVTSYVDDEQVPQQEQYTDSDFDGTEVERDEMIADTLKEFCQDMPDGYKGGSDYTLRFFPGPSVSPAERLEIENSKEPAEDNSTDAEEDDGASDV